MDQPFSSRFTFQITGLALLLWDTWLECALSLHKIRMVHT